MKISIIIPVLNEAPRLAHLVPYLIENGKDRVLEVIVVDGKSTDGSANIAQAAGAKVLSSKYPCRASQMNQGANVAQGEVLYFVHADTLPPTSFASDILHAIADGYSMGCYRYQFDSNLWILRINAFFTRFKWLWCQGGDKTFFIKRETFAAYGGYDEQKTIMEEYDFLIRASKQHQLYIIPKNALVSARKYQHNGWLRVQIANLLAFNLFRFGCAPEKIKRVYKSILRANP